MRETRAPSSTVLYPSAPGRDLPGGATIEEGTYRALLRLAGPLILASVGFMLMMFVDALLLSWHSKDAIAAVIPASMVSYLLKSIPLGVAAYTATLVAQYVGANRPERVGATTWQGIYFAMGSGAVVALMAFGAEPLFAWAGHSKSVQALEVDYLRIMCWGAPLVLMAGALSGFFAGRGDTWALMAAQLVGFVLNSVLDYLLIFGAFGWPEWGVAGAAVATVSSQGVVAVILAFLFFAKAHRRRYATWKVRGLDLDLFRRLIRFGFPNGVRIFVSIAAWTYFLFLVGRLNPDGPELAATNIAWRINGLAFFPIIGLSQAVAILVGQAQGRGRSDLATQATARGLALAQMWMVGAALLFLLFPRTLFLCFYDSDRVALEEFKPILETGVVLLRFVALYCLFDAVNLILMSALQSAGDTRWTLAASGIAHAVFLTVMEVLFRYRPSLYLLWGVATTFLMLEALIWGARFRSGRWRKIRVIERVDS